jgi:hypothetical protein
MVKYAEDIVKRISKGLIPHDIFLHINNAFTAIDVTKDLSLFDIKQLKMAIISLRLNKNEEEMVNFLSEYYEQDKSSLIKYSLKELYEDIIDKQVIGEYEKREKNGEINFVNSNEIMDMIKIRRSGT